jgi:hypothetical protein
LRNFLGTQELQLLRVAADLAPQSVDRRRGVPGSFIRSVKLASEARERRTRVLPIATEFLAQIRQMIFSDCNAYFGSCDAIQLSALEVSSDVDDGIPISALRTFTPSVYAMRRERPSLSEMICQI